MAFSLYNKTRSTLLFNPKDDTLLFEPIRSKAVHSKLKSSAFKIHRWVLYKLKPQAIPCWVSLRSPCHVGSKAGGLRGGEREVEPDPGLRGFRRGSSSFWSKTASRATNVTSRAAISCRRMASH